MAGHQALQGFRKDSGQANAPLMQNSFLPTAPPPPGLGFGPAGAPTMMTMGNDAAPPSSNLELILAQLEVTIADAQELAVLHEYEIVVICDDSGSMNMVVEGGKSRWDEQKETVSLILDVGGCFDQSGIDVYFLNRQSLHGVVSSQDPRFQQTFAQRPAGLTPLTAMLGQVAQEHGSRPTLLIILTDGEPTEGAQAFAAKVRQVVASGKVKIQVMACTDDDQEIGWLNVLDEELKEMDCTDDYRSEKKQVLASGRVGKFTRGDWVMKALLGPISQKFDAWDEGPQRGTAASGRTGCCCCCCCPVF